VSERVLRLEFVDTGFLRFSGVARLDPPIRDDDEMPCDEIRRPDKAQ
jgi:hypothetical protein